MAKNDKLFQEAELEYMKNEAKCKVILRCFFDALDPLVTRCSKETEFHPSSEAMLSTALTLTAAAFPESFPQLFSDDYDDSNEVVIAFPTDNPPED